jgi:hypothetical protein
MWVIKGRREKGEGKKPRSGCGRGVFQESREQRAEIRF